MVSSLPPPLLISARLRTVISQSAPAAPPAAAPISPKSSPGGEGAGRTTAGEPYLTPNPPLPIHRCATRGRLGCMKRVVIVGPGASGKSRLAVELGKITGLPVIELDKIFWRPGLVATPRDQWAVIQQDLVQQDKWILDGDLGPNDAVEVRLRAADTVIFLDLSPIRCVWRAARRSRERLDFWLWLLRYHWQSRPLMRKAIRDYASKATIRVLHDPRAVRQFLAEMVDRGSGSHPLAAGGSQQPR